MIQYHYDKVAYAFELIQKAKEIMADVSRDMSDRYFEEEPRSLHKLEIDQLDKHIGALRKLKARYVRFLK